MEKSIFSQAYDVFCRILRETRQSKGITQVQLAKALGRPQSFVAKIEGGERRVDVVEFIAIAKGLKVSPDELLARLIAELERTKKRAK
jgi:transcriptional regulator with XRE-family HTH domain